MKPLAGVVKVEPEVLAELLNERGTEECSRKQAA